MVVTVENIEYKIRRLVKVNEDKSLEEQLIAQYEIDMLIHLAEIIKRIEPYSLSSKIQYCKREGYLRAIKEYMSLEKEEFTLNKKNENHLLE